MGPNERKIIKIALWLIGGLILFGFIFGAVFYFKKTAYNEERVIVNVSGPESIDSTQTGEFIIKMKNNNRVKLSNARVILNYSENFQPELAENIQILSAVSSKIYIGEIGKHEEKEVKLKGKFFAPRDHIVYLRAILEYSPGGISGTFQAQGQLGISVKTSPIFLEVSAPLNAADNNEVEYTLDYRNLSEKNYNEIRIKVEYPGGFNFVSSEPRPAESNNFWYIGNLAAGENGQIKIRGRLKGEKGEGKIVKASLGTLGMEGKFIVYTENEKKTLMVAAPFSIIQTVDGISNLSFNAGDELSYLIEYKNISEIGMRDVIITLNIESRVVDFSKLRLESGHYDASLRTITWKAVDIPELARLEPGRGGTIRLKIPILDRLPVENENDKNFTLFTLAKIDSPDVPTPIDSNKIVSSSSLELKLNSKIVMEVKGYYNDQKIANSGPIPLQVGKETTYTIHWGIINVNNEISEVEVVSSLPGGVKWKGKFLPENENLTYNERTNQVIWRVGKLKNGTGITSEKREVYFQIGFTPQVNQFHTFPLILNETVLTAKDLFTNENLKVLVKEKNTALSEDPLAASRVEEASVE